MMTFLWLSSLYLIGRLPINSAPGKRTLICAAYLFIVELAVLSLFEAPVWAKVIYAMTLFFGQVGFVLLAWHYAGKPLCIIVMRIATMALGLTAIACLAVQVDFLPNETLIAPFWDWAAKPTRLLHFTQTLTSCRFAANVFAALLTLRETGNVVAFTLFAFRVTIPTNQAFHHSGMIGSVERLLVLIFTRFYQFNAVAFILTAKTVVRFHDARDTDAAEYLLLGTLVSTLLAILTGMSVSYLCPG